MSKAVWRRDKTTGGSIREQGEKFADGWTIGEGELRTDIAALQGADMFNVREIASAAGIETSRYFITRVVRPEGFEWDVYDRAEEPPSNKLAPGPRFKLFLRRNPDFPDRPQALERRKGEVDAAYETRMLAFKRRDGETDPQYKQRLLEHPDGQEVLEYWNKIRYTKNGKPHVRRKYLRPITVAAPSSEMPRLKAALKAERVGNRIEGRARARKKKALAGDST